jgi:hypothetical protein
MPSQEAFTDAPRAEFAVALPLAGPEGDDGECDDRPRKESDRGAPWPLCRAHDGRPDEPRIDCPETPTESR